MTYNVQKLQVVVGQRFGELTVIDAEVRMPLRPSDVRLGRTLGPRAARLQCACGVEVERALGRLLKGHYAHCGLHAPPQIADRLESGVRVCPRCHIEKRFEDFGVGLCVGDTAPYCRICFNEYTRERRKDPIVAEACRVSSAASRARNGVRPRSPEMLQRQREQTAAWYRKNGHTRNLRYFSKTPEWYASKLEEQGGRCGACRYLPGSRRLDVDHDHRCCPEMGKSCGECVRGLLCRKCNFQAGLCESGRVQPTACGPGVVDYLRSYGWDEESELFDAISPMAMLQMIVG